MRGEIGGRHAKKKGTEKVERHKTYGALINNLQEQEVLGGQRATLDRRPKAPSLENEVPEHLKRRNAPGVPINPLLP